MFMHDHTATVIVHVDSPKFRHALRLNDRIILDGEFEKQRNLLALHVLTEGTKFPIWKLEIAPKEVQFQRSLGAPPARLRGVLLGRPVQPQVRHHRSPTARDRWHPQCDFLGVETEATRLKQTC